MNGPRLAGESRGVEQLWSYVAGDMYNVPSSGNNRHINTAALLPRRRAKRAENMRSLGKSTCRAVRKWGLHLVTWTRAHELFLPFTTPTLATASRAYTRSPSTHMAVQGSAAKISLSLPVAESRGSAAESVSESIGASLGLH